MLLGIFKKKSPKKEIEFSIPLYQIIHIQYIISNDILFIHFFKKKKFRKSNEHTILTGQQAIAVVWGVFFFFLTLVDSILMFWKTKI